MYETSSDEDSESDVEMESSESDQEQDSVKYVTNGKIDNEKDMFTKCIDHFRKRIRLRETKKSTFQRKNVLVLMRIYFPENMVLSWLRFKIKDCLSPILDNHSQLPFELKVPKKDHIPIPDDYDSFVWSKMDLKGWEFFTLITNAKDSQKKEMYSQKFVELFRTTRKLWFQKYRKKKYKESLVELKKKEKEEQKRLRQKKTLFYMDMSDISMNFHADGCFHTFIFETSPNSPLYDKSKFKLLNDITKINDVFVVNLEFLLKL